MVTFTITVASGTGSTEPLTRNYTHITRVCIQVPSATSPTYGYSVVDGNGFGVAGNMGPEGSNGLGPGNVTLADEFPFQKGFTFSIVQASVDGTYKVELYEVTDD